MRAALIIFLIFFLSGCSREQKDVSKPRDEVRIERLSRIEQVRPEKPVKIKIKRDAQGRYSWELSGDNPDEVIKIDRRLRKAFGPEQSGQ